jgi:hypothetical protein
MTLIYTYLSHLNIPWNGVKGLLTAGPASPPDATIPPKDTPKK